MPDSTMIRLEDVTKEYAGQPEPAVDHVTMDIPEGNLVIFLGPSGCGKTTTLKMINRLIEPSSGRIFLAGEDVTRADVNLLRRRIGYVIQQIGLFPHMSIADNIAVVPKMLGWERKKIDDRVDTLLEMVGLNPSTHRNRYPKQLSGGQQQRVGVARALAADPPVLLMDEPFGATDPITREHLQDELIRIQASVRKTIVFVTHDIDEAIKLGDRIAIFRERSQIAQYAPPDEILSHPANDFVSSFVGVGASLKRLQVIAIRNTQLEQWPALSMTDSIAAVRDALHGDKAGVVLLDEQNRPRRTVQSADLTETGGALDTLGTPITLTVDAQETLHIALDKLLNSEGGAVCVVDERGVYQGIITVEMIMRELRSTSHQHAAPVHWGAAHE